MAGNYITRATTIATIIAAVAPTVTLIANAYDGNQMRIAMAEMAMTMTTASTTMVAIANFSSDYDMRLSSMLFMEHVGFSCRCSCMLHAHSKHMIVILLVAGKSRIAA